MKNTQKAVILVLCVVLCAFGFSCASSGGGGSGPDAAAAPAISEPYHGVWELTGDDDSGDKGTSTVTLTEAEEEIDGKTVKTYRFVGEVTNGTQYGLISAILTPDADTLAVLKKCSAISFKLLGDGRPYNVEAPISTVTDWGFHRFPIKTTPGTAQEYKIDLKMFQQPSWATAVRFNKERLTMIRVQTFNAAEGGIGPFDFKIWDITLYP